MKNAASESSAPARPALAVHLPDVGRLPPMSASVTESLALLDTPGIDMRRLARVLGRDLALASRLLRVANSPFYGLSGRIASIKDACILLGIHTIRSMVLVAGAMERFPASQRRVLDREALWQHAFFTAAAARFVATASRRDPDTAFAAGLLHDVGRFVLDEICPEAMRRLPAGIDEGDTLLDFEREHCGADHAHIGAIVVEQWHLPPPIIEAVAGHHHPPAERPEPGFDDIVHVAEALCGTATASPAAPPAIEPVSLARLGATGANLADWVEGVRRFPADQSPMSL